MPDERVAKIVELQLRGGVAPGSLMGNALRVGRFGVSTASFDPNLQLVGGDPWFAPDYLGLVVPTAPTPASSPQKRYLFLLARVQFNAGERVRLVGLRQYASLFGDLLDGQGNLVQTFEQQITSPAFRFLDGNISWHVMILPKTYRDRRNPANADSLIYQDAYSPALLYQTLAPYVAPNGGRPWGKSIGSDLGNLHDMRFPWQPASAEVLMDLPIPAPCDVAFFASVAQTNMAGQPSFATITTAQQASLAPDWQFAVAFANHVRFGRVAGSLIFQEEDYAK